MDLPDLSPVNRPPLLPGDMGARILGHDWTGTTLGPIGEWDPALTGMLATLLAARTQIVLFWGPDHLAFYNDAYAPTIGIKHPGALGRPARESWAELWDDLGPMLERVRLNGETIGARDRPFRIQRHGHLEEVFFDISYSPLRDGVGAIRGVLCLVTETTDRVRAEARATASETTLRLATEAAGVGTWDHDLLGGTVHWDPHARRLFDLYVDEPASFDRLRAALHPDDRARILQAFAAALDPAQRAPYDVEYRIVSRRDGQIRWIAARGRGLFDDDGRAIRAIGTVVDITARRAAQQALEESEARFRAVADSAPALIWMCDNTGALVFANRWHEQMFGRDGAALAGEGWRAIIHPDDLPGFAAAFDAAFADRAPFGRQVRVIDRHGRPRWLRCEARPRLVEDRFAGYVGCDVDVTDAHLAAAALERRVEERTGELAASNRRLLAELEERERMAATMQRMQRLEAVGQLTSGVAHDFNNLLTVILGNIDLLSRTADADERAGRRLATMRTAAQRGAALTAQLLAFSRRQRLEARAVDVRETLANLRELIASTMGGSVRLETGAADDLWPALADATQLELVVLNLAINARDAMPVGGLLRVEASNVTLGDRQRPEEPGPGDYVMIAVTDTGTGMPPHVLDRVFEPFFTTKPVGKGSGLGLAQVYGFAKQSGGGVRIETAEGRGTSVRVFLPRTGAAAVAPADPSAPADAPDAAGRRILLVDDDAAVREVTAAALAAMNARITEAGSAASALEALAQTKGGFDLLVADFAMPGMNGAELATAVTARWPALPVLFVTGYADLAALGRVDDAQVVQKPFRPDELQRKAAQLLGGDRPR